MLSPRHLKHLGGALKALRGASGCTQAEVCARTGLKRPQLSRWENGRDVPTLESLVRYLGAVGAGLADLERVLLGDEEEKRRAEITRALREIRADHQDYLRTDFDVQLAFTRIARPNPDGLERRWLRLLGADALPAARRQAPDATAADAPPPDGVAPAPEAERLKEAPAAAPDGEALDAGAERLNDAPAAASGDEALDAEAERLIAELPHTWDELLDAPACRIPAVVERLIDRGWALREHSDARYAVVTGDAARLLAGELPGGFGRDRCFALRARSLELWGTALRAAGDPVTAEAALLAAFELLAQTPDPEPAELAAILGRLALAAADRGYREDAERYAGEAVRVVRASDPEWPMPAFTHLWRAVGSDFDGGESFQLVSRAVFNGMWQAYDGFQNRMWELALEIVEGNDELRERVFSDMASWAPDGREDARFHGGEGPEEEEP